MGKALRSTSVRISYLILEETTYGELAALFSSTYKVLGAGLVSKLFSEHAELFRILTARGGNVVVGVSIGAEHAPTVFMNTTVTVTSVRGLPQELRGNVAQTINVEEARLLAKHLVEWSNSNG